MSRAIAAVLCSFVVAGCASAPTPEPTADERAVLAAVQALFDVIASQDRDAGARVTVPEGTLVSVRADGDRRVLRHFTHADWLARMPAEGPPNREAFDGRPVVMVDGDVAMVWAPYVFEVGGERSHTGVDVFALVRTDDGWKIAGGAYSVVR